MTNSFVISVTLLSKASCKTHITATLGLHVLPKHTVIIIHSLFLMRLEPTGLCLSAGIFIHSRMGLRALKAVHFYRLILTFTVTSWGSSAFIWQPWWKEAFRQRIHHSWCFSARLNENHPVDFLLPLWFMLPSSTTIPSFFSVPYFLQYSPQA